MTENFEAEPDEFEEAEREGQSCIKCVLFKSVTAALQGKKLLSITLQKRLIICSFNRHVFVHVFMLPSQLKLGVPHPDPLVESSSLAAVDAPDITYNIGLPGEVRHCPARANLLSLSQIIAGGLLSSAQLETVAYSSQMFQGL